ncbi:DDB1- and CUL4-associated factor 4-like protein 1 [Linum perenne]
MPQELPGFYYDEEKNRYFPIKGRIPGSSRAPDGRNPKKAKTSQDDNVCRTRVRTHRLIQGRELNGNVVSVGKSKFNFVHEYQKTQASQPTVWRYQGSEIISCDAGLDETSLLTQTPDGLVDGEVLVAGSQNRCLSIIDLRKDVPNRVMPDRVWPGAVPDITRCNKAPDHVGVRLIYYLDSAISSVKLLCRKSHANYDLGSDIQYGLYPLHHRVTTLGSESTEGAVYVLNLAGEDDAPALPSKIVSSNCTIWTADSNSNASEAVIGKDIEGTSKGAAMVRLETGSLSWLFRNKSDVMAQQLDKLGKIVLCGLRNGEILTVDARVKPRTHPGRHVVQKNLTGASPNWSSFLQGNKSIDSSSTLWMPSSVCSLVSLQLYDQYFMAGSMDGTIRLYDHRMTKRGPVQAYEGHVNSHTRLPLRVDPSEKFLVAGLTLYILVEKTAIYASGVSSPVNCCLTKRCLKQSPRLCVCRKGHRRGHGHLLTVTRKMIVYMELTRALGHGVDFEKDLFTQVGLDSAFHAAIVHTGKGMLNAGTQGIL